MYDPNSDLKRLLYVDCKEGMPKQPPFWPEKAQERIEWSWKRYCVQMENLNWLKDSTIPCLSMLTGTEIFAEAMGCKVHRPAGLPTCALSLINNSQEAARLKRPAVMSSSLAQLFEMADKLREKAGKDVLFSLPDVQSPMDIVNLIWKREDLYIAMIEEPEAVKEVSAMVKELLFEFFDLWFERYGKEFIAHWPWYYMLQGITLSEDDIGVVSGDMFKDFFEKELQELSLRYGGIGIHCCADSQHQWSHFKNIPDLKLLNLARPYDVTMEAYKFFEEKTAQWHFLDRDNIMDVFKPEVPRNARIVTWAFGVETKKEAIDIVNRFDEELEKFNNEKL